MGCHLPTQTYSTPSQTQDGRGLATKCVCLIPLLPNPQNTTDPEFLPSPNPIFRHRPTGSAGDPYIRRNAQQVLPATLTYVVTTHHLQVLHLTSLSRRGKCNLQALIPVNRACLAACCKKTKRVRSPDKVPSSCPRRTNQWNVPDAIERNSAGKPIKERHFFSTKTKPKKKNGEITLGERLEGSGRERIGAAMEVGWNPGNYGRNKTRPVVPPPPGDIIGHLT